MVDPISQKLTQEIAKTAVTDLKSTPKPTSHQVEQSAFGQMFDQKVGATEPNSNQNLLKIAENVMSDFNGKPMNAIPANDIKVDIKHASETQFETNGNGNLLASFLGDVNNGSMQMDKVITQITSGATKFSMKDMLQVQVLAQNHSMMVEMMSKGVEIGSRTIQSTSQMQI